MRMNDSCYLCKYLVFMENLDFRGYYCTISGRKYVCQEESEKCSNYCYEREE